MSEFHHDWDTEDPLAPEVMACKRCGVYNSDRQDCVVSLREAYDTLVRRAEQANMRMALMHSGHSIEQIRFIMEGK